MAKKSTTKKDSTATRSAASGKAPRKKIAGTAKGMTKATTAAQGGAAAKTKKSAPTRKRGGATSGNSSKAEAVAAASADGAGADAAARRTKLAQGGASGGRKGVVAKAAPKKVATATVLKGYDKPSTAEAGQGEALTESQLRRAKSGLTRKDLNLYRENLLHKRAEILGDVESLETDAQNGAGGGISYEHMADAGSDNFEQEFTLGLVESERKLLAEINEALLRMKKGIYGVCMQRGTPIGKTRLDAKPWAKWCIEVAREREARGLP